MCIEKNYSMKISTRFNSKFGAIDLGRWTLQQDDPQKYLADPELEKLRDKLKRGTNIKQIRHELLEKLVTEYEQNDCIGPDPYKQFSDIIQKLNFGSPFVDHVAKKTYVKSKNCIEDKEVTTSAEKSLNCDNLEYSEEEYQKLLEEFGEEI